MKDLRADQGFREVARYPAWGTQPSDGYGFPNAAVYQGGQYGQAQLWLATCDAFRLWV